MKKRIDEIQESARIIDAIADKLIEDHVEMMDENRSLLAEIEKKDAEIEALRSELALVAAAEREACAKMFDGKVWAYDYRDIAAAIRARGKK